MSRIVRNTAGCRGVSHVVETEDGKQYAVSSIHLDPQYRTFGYMYETAVFRWNKQAQMITNWMDLVMERHITEAEMLKAHEEICENLEKYIKGE